MVLQSDKATSVGNKYVVYRKKPKSSLSSFSLQINVLQAKKKFEILDAVSDTHRHTSSDLFFVDTFQRQSSACSSHLMFHLADSVLHARPVLPVPAGLQPAG